MPPMASIRGTPYAHELFTRSMLSRIVQATRPQRGGYQTPLAFAIMQVRINLMPYGLPTIAFRLFKLPLISRFRARDFSLARYSRIAQVFIDKEVVFSIFACSPCSRRSSYFLASAFPQAEFRLCRHKPLGIFTICSSDGLELKPLPSGFHRSRGCGAFGLFSPPPPAACFRFAAGLGAFVVGACAPHLLCIGRTLSLDTNFAIFI